MGFCDFGPPGNVVRMAVAACLWPTTFKIPTGSTQVTGRADRTPVSQTADLVRWS